MVSRLRSSPFSDAVKDLKSTNITERTQNSLMWYKKYTSSKLAGINTFTDVKNTGEVLEINKLKLGSIYTFMYSPKHKDTLEYYDTTPLIIPFKDEGDSFYAFNLHYLPMTQRAMVLDALFKINTVQRGKTPELHAKYEVAMAMSKSALFKPCIKRYLKSHVKSKFLEFKPEHWELSIFLPIANFKKMTEARVHKFSMDSINKKKG